MRFKDWPEYERPRERFWREGPEALSDSELIAIALRTGVQGQSAMDLAKQLLKQSGGIYQLLQISCDDFCTLPGLGPNKYLQLQIGQAIWKRYHQASMQLGSCQHSDSAKLALSELGHEEREVFACLFLDAKRQLISFERLFYGTLRRAQVYTREILKAALKHNADAVIFVHNHPGGTAEPSEADRLMTRELASALSLADVLVVDHLVVGGGQVQSVCKRGIF